MNDDGWGRIRGIPEYGLSPQRLAFTAFWFAIWYRFMDLDIGR